MPQTDYSIYQDQGFDGELISSYPNGVRSGINAGTVTLPFGRVTVKGTGDNDGVLPSATGGRFFGVALKTDILEKDFNGVTGYKPGRPYNRLMKGDVLMITEQAVTPADPVFFRHTLNSSPGPNEAVGRLRKDADTARADALTRAQFMATAGAGELVRVYFDY